MMSDVLSENPNGFNLACLFNLYHVELMPPCSGDGAQDWLSDKITLLVRDQAQGVSVYAVGDYQLIPQSSEVEVYGVKKPGCGDEAAWRYVKQLDVLVGSTTVANEVITPSQLKKQYLKNNNLCHQSSACG
jgi:hypothetical protein